jgi:hypothetical protein
MSGGLFCSGSRFVLREGERERESVCESERANFQSHYSSSRPMQYPSWVHSVLHRDMIVSRVSLHTYADNTPFPWPSIRFIRGRSSLPAEPWRRPSTCRQLLLYPPGPRTIGILRRGIIAPPTMLCSGPLQSTKFPIPFHPGGRVWPSDESSPPTSLAKPVTHQNQRAFTEADGGSDAISPCCHGSKAHY